MRPKGEFTYEIDYVPEPPPELLYLQQRGGVSDEEAYQVWNMGVGYCIYSPRQFGEIIASTAEERGMRCYALGHVVEGPKKVIIKPEGIIYQ